MKTPLQKLRGFASSQHDRKDRKFSPKQPLFDEVAQADQDMQDIRDCYDRLLSSAAATANCAYEFSESLKELGDCLLEKTAVSNFDDEESGKVLLMLGKVQLELQRLVDNYRSHISQTITIPSESLLNELHTVEEMKRQCDIKREEYKDILTKHREKGKLRNSKGESIHSHKVQVAREDYDVEANALIFRVRSLKQGQCRSLLTQAARHHAAQLCFFRKAFKSLEAIEPQVKSVTEEQHIDYYFSGLDDDDDDDDDEEDYDEYRSRDESELSFDYQRNNKRRDATLRNSVEESEGESPRSDSFAFSEDVKTTSKSAPLFPEKRFDTTERNTYVRVSPSHKYASYALPTPREVKSPVSTSSDTEVPGTKRSNSTSFNLWHSSPLNRKNYETPVRNEKYSGHMLLDSKSEKLVRNDKYYRPMFVDMKSEKLARNEIYSGPMLFDTKSVLREKNNNLKQSPLPPPLSGSLLSPQSDPSDESYYKKAKRYAFSGPLTGKPGSNKPTVTVSGPIGSRGYPFLSVSVVQTPMPPPSLNSKSTSQSSPTLASSPKISELHELPRPPPHLASRRQSARMDHSAPLVSQGPELSPADKSTASKLPVPPSSVARSYSIPSRVQKDTALHVLKPLETPRSSIHASEDVGSPTSTPISLSDSQPPSASS